MEISIIIVTYNSAGQISLCLDSLLKQAGVGFEVLVVDNASQDSTLAELKKFGQKIQAIASPENLGFGRGNNLGFAASKGRYIYLLNPDARLDDAGALKELCQSMEANPRWGMAGTVLRSSDGGHESRPATEYPGQRHVSRDFSKLPGGIAWVGGASMVIRRELYEKLGGFDPDFFLYSEETDFCLRMRELGFEVGHISKVTVEHIGGASEDLHDPYGSSARKLRGLILFRQKHYPPADCVWLAKRDLRRARFRMVWNSLLARLQPPRSTAWLKYRQYRAIWEVSLEYLCSTSNKSPLAGFGTQR